MKTLYLGRHAKSSWDYSELSDFERPLNKRGRRDAPFMGNLFREIKLLPNLIISSPALRAYYTARTIAEEIGYPLEELETSEIIYEGDSGDLIELIQSVDDEVDSLMIFGHNPTLTLTHNYLCDKRIDNIPTCALTAIEFDIDGWEEVESGRHLFFEYPKKHLNKK